MRTPSDKFYTGPSFLSEAVPEAKRLLGALANSRGHRHEENAAKLVSAALELPIEVGVALLASADGYTPRSTKLIEGAREKIGTLPEVAYALAENLPPPKAHSSRRRSRRCAACRLFAMRKLSSFCAIMRHPFCAPPVSQNKM